MSGSNAVLQHLPAHEPVERPRPVRPLDPPDRQGASWHSAEVSLPATDRLACRLKAALDRIAVPLARAARVFVSRKKWHAFGYARADDFGRECFQRSGRWLRDFASLGNSLAKFPQLENALIGRDGGEPLGSVAATWIGRIASSASLGAWIALARTATARDLREAIRAARADDSVWPPGLEPETERSGAGAVDPLAEEAVPPERHTVRMPVPAPVRAAFDEALDLYRAVEGSEATVDSFAEALAAEAAAGDPPDDGFVAPPSPGHSRARMESALARATGGWRDLRSHREDVGEAELSCPELRQLEKLESAAGTGNGDEIAEQIRQLLDLEESMQARLGRLLTEMSERGAWARLRFTDAGHYAEERLRISRSSAEKRCRLERALRRFPKLRRACELGAVGSESALLVAQILGRRGVEDRVEREWVNHAMFTSVKRLRDEVRHHGRVSLDRDGNDKPAGDRPLPPDDATWHASLRRAPGTARDRVLALGHRSATNPTADVFLTLRLRGDTASDFRSAIEHARRRLQESTTDRSGDLPPSRLLAQTFSNTGRRVPPWLGLFALLEEFVTVWDDPRAMPKRPGDAIYIRDGWRCAAPGCTSRRNLEDHHVVYRSHGGSNNLSNRISLCRFHHQHGEHGNLASCRGTAPLGLAWRLGRPELGVWFRNERRLDVPPWDRLG